MSDRLTDERLDALEAMDKAATKGKWFWSSWRGGDPSSLESEDCVVIRLEDQYQGYPECGEDLRMDISEEDKAIITAIRNAAPELLAGYRRGLEAERLLREAKNMLKRNAPPIGAKESLYEEINAHLKGGDDELPT